MKNKISRLSHEVSRARFNASTRGVFDVSPIACSSTGPTIITMLSRRDVSMYLLAIKSFARFCSPRRVIVLDDGTLTAANHSSLRRQVVGIEFVHIRAVDIGRCQAGGTWERLCLIGEICATEYVMQMDSDMICLRRPTQVIDLIGDRLAFTMPGDVEGSQIVSARQAADSADLLSGNLFQLRFERRLRLLPHAEDVRYVRGCSALAGFPAASISLAAIEGMHSAFETIVGRDDWRTWGSEQITSNALVANSQGAVVLSSSDYCSYFPIGTAFDFSTASMVHFIGTHRFDNGLYDVLANRVLRELRVSAT